MGKRKNRFGTPHRKYHQFPKLINEIKQSFFDMYNDEWMDKKQICSTLQARYGATKTTLYRWINKWKMDPSYDPTNTSVHGNFHRIFTDEQEGNIIQYIKTNFIQKGNYFSDFYFESVIYNAFNEIYPDPKKAPRFECSPGFINDFKNRNKISSRLAHFRQRPLDKNETDIENEIQIFRSEINELIQKVSNSNEVVLNADETGFQILPTSIRTWAFKNDKNVSINVYDNDKDRVSVMATISSNFDKLPMFIIAKANDEDEAEEQLGPLINNNESTFSKKSYMTTECFINYLQFLRKQYPDNRTIHLIIDRYSSHTSKESISKAESLNIKLYFIPAHFTDLLQPLDIAIFAPLKSMANSKIRRLLLENNFGIIGIRQSILYLQQAWEDLPISTLMHAWEQYT